MKQPPPIPRLIQIIAGSNAAGDAADQAFRSASSRLLSWSAAFDQWLAELWENYKPSAYKAALQAWQRLLRQQGRPPWELASDDIHAHLVWLDSQGYAANTIANALGYLAGFYHWCAGQQVDPGCPPGFNPAQGVPHPQNRYYIDAQLLSQAEIHALLEVLSRYRTPLGKRHYAFFLARLHTGVRHHALLNLRWGQLERDAAGVWLRWRAEADRVPLALEAWQAIQEWLIASGRLAGLSPERYIFTPLVNAKLVGGSERPQDWVEDRALSDEVMRSALKSSGRQAGIPAQKLTLNALRLTALRLRLDAGDTPQQMKAFMDSALEPSYARFRLRKLPQLPPDSPGPGAPGLPPEPPPRKTRQFIAQATRKHGMYAHHQPSAEVRAVFEEKIRGVDEEITGLRTLERGLMSLLGQKCSRKDAAQAMSVLTQIAGRLAEMIKLEKELLQVDQKELEWQKEFESIMNLAAEGDDEQEESPQGEPPAGPQADTIAETPGSEFELEVGARQIDEEIASTRLVLRKAMTLARKAEQEQQPAEYIKLARLYHLSCYRLLQLLLHARAERQLLSDTFAKAIEEAFAEVSKEWSVFASLK